MSARPSPSAELSRAPDSVQVIAQDGERVGRAALAEQDAGAEPGGHGQQADGLGSNVEFGGHVPGGLSGAQLRDEEVFHRVGSGQQRLGGQRRVGDGQDGVRGVDHVPTARAEIVQGAGHGLPLERPDFVNARILGFVDATSGSSVPRSRCGEDVR